MNQGPLAWQLFQPGFQRVQVRAPQDNAHAGRTRCGLHQIDEGFDLFAEVVDQHQVDAQLLAYPFQAIVPHLGDAVATIGERLIVGKSDGDGGGVNKGFVVAEHDRLVADQDFAFRRSDLHQADGRLAGRADGLLGVLRGVGASRKFGVLGGQLHGESHAGGYTTLAAVGLGQQLKDL